MAVERRSVDVCIFLTSAPATDHPDCKYGDDRNTSKSGTSISSNGADAGTIVLRGGRRKRRGRVRGDTGGPGGAGDSELLSGNVSAY